MTRPCMFNCNIKQNWISYKERKQSQATQSYLNSSWHGFYFAIYLFNVFKDYLPQKTVKKLLWYHQSVHVSLWHTIDVDFPENLKVPVKYEPQSIHWSHEQVTIHSAILKYQGRRVTKLIYQRTLNMISNLWTWFCMKCWMIFQTCLPTSLM